MRTTVVFSAALLVAFPSTRCASGDGGGLPGAANGGGEPEGGGDAGGGIADECAGLGPATVGQPSASVVISGGPDERWSPGASDGSGTVALKMTNDNQEPSLRIRLFDPSGAERGMYQAAEVTLGESVVGQFEGFEVSYADYAHDRGVLVALDENGSVAATTDITGAVPGPVRDDLAAGSWSS